MLNFLPKLFNVFPRNKDNCRVVTRKGEWQCMCIYLESFAIMKSFFMPTQRGSHAPKWSRMVTPMKAMMIRTAPKKNSQEKEACKEWRKHGASYKRLHVNKRVLCVFASVFVCEFTPRGKGGNKRDMNRYMHLKHTHMYMQTNTCTQANTHTKSCVLTLPTTMLYAILSGVTRERASVPRRGEVRKTALQEERQQETHQTSCQLQYDCHLNM